MTITITYKKSWALMAKLLVQLITVSKSIKNFYLSKVMVLAIATN